MINIYPDLSNEDYHALEGISRSGIMRFLESPYKYWADYINPDRPKIKSPSNAMEFGSAFHTFVLEPHKFDELYVVEPAKVFLKDVGREAFDLYKEHMIELESSNKTILLKSEFDLLNKMKAALLDHPIARGFIEGGIYESSYFWEDPHTGLICKARPDILHCNAVVDLKTIADSGSRSYQYSMVDGGYHIQGAMILEGLKQCRGYNEGELYINTVINVCIEKTYPYQIGIKIISEHALEIGHQKFKQALLDIKECMQTSKWSSNATEVVELPNWAL
jgi:exodeoxyribonuclease VIII